MMRWYLSNKGDFRALQIANRHYNRQTHDSRQFVPPGQCLVLVTPNYDALWVTSWPRFAQHAWQGAWVCTAFRNENRANLSSELIREAVAVTLSRFGFPPRVGMITFVNPKKIKAKRDPGRCFLRAGFTYAGRTKRRNLIALHLDPKNMPQPTAANNFQRDFVSIADLL